VVVGAALTTMIVDDITKQLSDQQAGKWKMARNRQAKKKGAPFRTYFLLSCAWMGNEKSSQSRDIANPRYAGTKLRSCFGCVIDRRGGWSSELLTTLVGSRSFIIRQKANAPTTTAAKLLLARESAKE